ncbi:MAG: 2-oxoglutarate and iron-dependent oxygenase domain-containing protein [Chloroflexota bacterium]
MIPIINISQDKNIVAKQIAHACETIGFFMIEGHGIELSLIENVNEQAKQFFDLSAAEKNGYSVTGGMGYIGPSGEQLAASSDDTTVQDVKESLNLTLPIDPNSWPAHPASFQQNTAVYLQSLIDLAQKLMQLFALALELEEHWFDDKIDDPRTILRLLNYPPIQNQQPNLSRAGAHTDYGTLTILWSPDSRGLQAQNRQGEWVDVISKPEQFIINIGDLMMNWTNDRWISTPHKVVPQPETAGKRRNSLAFFHNPNPNALIKCIDTCCSEENPAKYEPILAKQHLEIKISKSLGQEVKLDDQQN